MENKKNSPAIEASERTTAKKTRPTPEQKIARLEAQIARAKSQMKQQQRSQETRAKIILGEAVQSYLDEVAEFLEAFGEQLSERDRQAIIACGSMDRLLASLEWALPESAKGSP